MDPPENVLRKMDGWCSNMTIYSYQPQNLIDKINSNGLVFVDFTETNLYKQT